MSSKIEENNSKFSQIKKAFLWTAVVILIGELIVGAIMILTGAWNATIGKIQLTFLLLGVFLFVGVNNFVRIEKGTSAVRGLAWMSLISNLIWLALGSLIIWGVIPALDVTSTNLVNYYGVSHNATITIMSVFSKLALAAAGLGAAGFWTSNVLSIRETVKPVKPLKITAVICELYCSGFEILIVLIGFENINYDENLLRWTQLSGLAGLAFVITALAALIISRSNRQKDNIGGSIQDDRQMQATIQEMVEKEVQERMKAEHEKAERDAMPPLQAEDMPPVVNRDGAILPSQADDVSSVTNERDVILHNKKNEDGDLNKHSGVDEQGDVNEHGSSNEYRNANEQGIVNEQGNASELRNTDSTGNSESAS